MSSHLLEEVLMKSGGFCSWTAALKQLELVSESQIRTEHVWREKTLGYVKYSYFRLLKYFKNYFENCKLNRFYKIWLTLVQLLKKAEIG